MYLPSMDLYEIYTVTVLAEERTLTLCITVSRCFPLDISPRNFLPGLIGIHVILNNCHESNLYLRTTLFSSILLPSENLNKYEGHLDQFRSILGSFHHYFPFSLHNHNFFHQSSFYALVQLML